MKQPSTGVRITWLVTCILGAASAVGSIWPLAAACAFIHALAWAVHVTHASE